MQSGTLHIAYSFFSIFNKATSMSKYVDRRLSRWDSFVKDGNW